MIASPSPLLFPLSAGAVVGCAESTADTVRLIVTRRIGRRHRQYLAVTLSVFCTVRGIFSLRTASVLLQK